MRKYWYYIIVFCGVLVLAGCGKEGDPVPENPDPPVDVPDKPDEPDKPENPMPCIMALSYRTNGRQLVLTLPRYAVECLLSIW